MYFCIATFVQIYLLQQLMSPKTLFSNIDNALLNNGRTICQPEYLWCTNRHCIRMCEHLVLLHSRWKNLQNMNRAGIRSAKWQKKRKYFAHIYVPYSKLVFQWLQYHVHLLQIETAAH